MIQSMYPIMKNVILSQGMPVEKLMLRTDIFFAQGKLTSEEKAELDQMIFDHQTIDAERAEMSEMYRALLDKVRLLEERVTALEGSDTPGAEDKYPAWEPWDGISTNYTYGYVVTHNGRIWRNVLEGVQNVWEPGVVDSRYWEELAE